MSQLLISVKNVEEALIARYAGVDLVDLKDPNVGALGALDVDVVRQVVGKLDGDVLISATVGEGHESIKALAGDIKRYASLGVDVVKIAASTLFYQQSFFDEMYELTAQDIRLVAVFFADEAPNLSLIQRLVQCGFYGAMLDTKQKRTSLMEVYPLDQIKTFLSLCEQHRLVSGLAGSVNIEHMSALLTLRPTFIGMRGGVCGENNRMAKISNAKVTEVRSMLLNYNNI